MQEEELKLWVAQSSYYLCSVKVTVKITKNQAQQAFTQPWEANHGSHNCSKDMDD